MRMARASPSGGDIWLCRDQVSSLRTDTCSCLKALFTTIAFFLHLLLLGQPTAPTNVAPSDTQIRRLLIGTWGGDGNDRHARLTFAANGTSTSTNWVTGKQRLNATPYAESIWEVRGGVLVSTVTKTGDARLCPLGSVWRTRVISINETNAVGVTQVGTTNTMARIK